MSDFLRRQVITHVELRQPRLDCGAVRRGELGEASEVLPVLRDERLVRLAGGWRGEAQRQVREPCVVGAVGWL